MTAYLQKIFDQYRAQGYAILADNPPPFGQPVFAARVVTHYGMGGSIQGTSRLGVTVVRLTTGQYWDTTNREQVPCSVLEAWKVAENRDFMGQIQVQPNKYVAG